MGRFAPFLQQLESRRQALLGRVDKIGLDLRRAGGPLEADSAERAAQTHNDDVLAGLDSAGREELARIDRALGRLQRGEYGSCVMCGGPIAAARLQALPESEFCVECAGSLTR